MIDRFLDFTQNITQAYKYIIKIKTHEMRTFGLKASHVMCLFYIGMNEQGLTPVELAALCMEDKAGISKSLNELKKQGYVQTDDDNGSRIYRAKYLVTEKGAETYERISSFIVTTVAECGKGLSDEERAAFYSALSVITGNLKEYCSKVEDGTAPKI